MLPLIRNGLDRYLQQQQQSKYIVKCSVVVIMYTGLVYYTGSLDHCLDYSV